MFLNYISEIDFNHILSLNELFFLDVFAYKDKKIILSLSVKIRRLFEMKG